MTCTALGFGDWLAGTPRFERLGSIATLLHNVGVRCVGFAANGATLVVACLVTAQQGVEQLEHFLSVLCHLAVVGPKQVHLAIIARGTPAPRFPLRFFQAVRLLE